MFLEFESIDVMKVNSVIKYGSHFVLEGGCRHICRLKDRGAGPGQAWPQGRGHLHSASLGEFGGEIVFVI